MKHGAKPEKSGDAKPPVLTIRKDSGAAMNTSKEDNMKLLIPSIFYVLAALSSMVSTAQTFGTEPVSAASSSATPQHILSVVYKKITADNKLTGMNQIPGLGDGTNATLKVSFFRPDDLVITSSRNNIFSISDRTSFTVNAPTPEVNRTLSLVGTAFQTPVDSSLTKCMQVLSMAVSRKINAAFAYSARINKSSRFDTAITYKLFPATDSGKSSELVASFQYGIKL